MSIYRDKRTGRWMFEFSHRIEGQRPRKRRLLPAGWTRAQADAYDRKESAALYAIASGIAKPRRTIDEAVARYLSERVPALKSAVIVRREIEATRDWWAGRAIEDLPEVASEYAQDQHGALQPATIMNRIAYLRSACRWAWKRHKMGDSDPGARVVVPTVSNRRHVYLTRAEMVKLARACGQWETRAMIRVAFYTGWRFAEIVRAEQVGDVLILGDSKNGQPRVLPIHRKIRHVLSLGWAWPEHETMSYWFRKAREAVGMPKLRFHDLRHSTASEIISNKGTLAEVGAVLGHKSAASSQRYAHLMTDALRATVNSIGGRR
jgi:integrase